MMYTRIPLLAFGVFLFNVAYGQPVWLGTYTGVVSGDSVYLEFTTLKEGKLTGTMRDSYNNYNLQGSVKNTAFSGTAVETVLGLTFQMTSSLNGDALTSTLVMDFLGTQNKMDLFLTRKKTGHDKTHSKAIASVSGNPVSKKLRDQNVIGLWFKESNYSSGYGFNDSYGSMSSREYLEFLADGRLASGGSSTIISGSSYSGSTTSSGQQIAEGWFWYSENNKIYLHISHEGQRQTVALGKYYIENGRMLITGDNGTKLLLTKS